MLTGCRYGHKAGRDGFCHAHDVEIVTLILRNAAGSEEFASTGKSGELKGQLTLQTVAQICRQHLINGLKQSARRAVDKDDCVLKCGTKYSVDIHVGGHI